ncbi:hypothetical protein CPC08DRAFT_433191 [Agrocybe pediades]|nr:hypothetical protein CPC08DRAFT_433191 [Agrocybe pediades]
MGIGLDRPLLTAGFLAASAIKLVAQGPAGPCYGQISLADSVFQGLPRSPESIATGPTWSRTRLCLECLQRAPYRRSVECDANNLRHILIPRRRHTIPRPAHDSDTRNHWRDPKARPLDDLNHLQTKPDGLWREK